MDAVEANLAEKLSLLQQKEGASSEYPFEYLRRPEGWVKQYVGYYSNGKPMIFLNLHPLEERNQDYDFSWMVVVVCDGSPNYFSAEYDVGRQAISRISFNYGWINVDDLTY